MPPSTTISWPMPASHPQGNASCTTMLQDISENGQQQQHHPRNSRYDTEMTRRVSMLTKTRSESYETQSSDCFQYDDNDVSKKGRRPQQRDFRVISFRLVNAVIWITFFAMFCRRNFGQGNPETTSATVGPQLRHQMIGPQVDVLVPEIIPPIPQRDIVHVIHTRYMQEQPDLFHLGLARLELLKAFPLASLEKQSSQNFIWIIRTDPNLNETLKASLIDAVQGFDRILLVASNDNPNIQINEIINLESESIWSGNHKNVSAYLSSAKKSGGLVLESRLDADDALHMNFVKTIQESARSYFASREAKWKIWCASRHVEWQYRAIWETETPEIGALLSMKDKECISTGLTVGYTQDVRVHDIPPMKHNQLAYSLPSCKKQKMECLDFVSLIPTALRARTPTSAGMLNILLKNRGKTNKKYEKAGAGKQVDLQFRLWQLIESAFGFSIDVARHVHSHLEQNMRAIATDNLKGQCTAGHSCKESSKEILKTIIDHPEYT